MSPQTRREFLGHAAKASCGSLALGVACPALAAGSPKPNPDSYCGIYCGACKNLRASAKETDPAKVKCLGCKSGKTAAWCTECKIKACAENKGLTSCGECKGFPCKKLTEFHNNGRDYRVLAEKSCHSVKEKGHAQWLKDQKKRWTCPKCGAALKWSDDTCPKCGIDILSGKEEAAAYRAGRDKK